MSEEEKRQKEADALDHIGEILGDCPARDQIRSLWEEYEAGETGEAKLVKDFDKIEMIVQAREYERDQGVNLQEFFDSTAGKWRTSLGESWANQIYIERDTTTE